MFPQPCTVRQATCTNVSMPRHAVTELISITYSTGWTFIHSAVQISDRLPDIIVYETEDNSCSVLHKSCAFLQSDVRVFSTLSWNHLHAMLSLMNTTLYMALALYILHFRLSSCALEGDGMLAVATALSNCPQVQNLW